MKKRCSWADPKNENYIKYHDEEWSVPVHDDRKLFEFLVLETFQAGLSWSTILNKRENFRESFDNFDFEKISNYQEAKITQLLSNPGIVRNKLKINATVVNAQRFQEVIREFGSFDKYAWGFVGGNQVFNHFKTVKDIPPTTEISDKFSKDLKKRGFKFVGSTIMYAFMQAVGMVNDHVEECFLYKR